MSVRRCACAMRRGLTAEEIAAVLEQFKKRVRIVAVVDSLKHLQKGGRLPAAVAIVGGALGIKPVLALKDGEIKLVDKGRGRPGALVAMFKQLDALGGIDPRYGYTLLYSDNKQLIAPVHHYMHQNLQLTGGRWPSLAPPSAPMSVPAWSAWCLWRRSKPVKYKSRGEQCPPL